MEQLFEIVKLLFYGGGGALILKLLQLLFKDWKGRRDEVQESRDVVIMRQKEIIDDLRRRHKEELEEVDLRHKRDVTHYQMIIEEDRKRSREELSEQQKVIRKTKDKIDDVESSVTTLKIAMVQLQVENINLKDQVELWKSRCQTMTRKVEAEETEVETDATPPPP